MTLLQAATEVRENAHAPYSRFKVGAALRTAEGTVFRGCNVENVAYPEGTCAEAGAIAAMCAAGERVIVEVCVIADSPEPVPPCGGCRQKLAEFGRSDPDINALSDAAALALSTALTARLRDGIASGELKSDLDADIAGRMLLTVKSGLKIAARGGASDREVAESVRLILTGLSAD